MTLKASLILVAIAVGFAGQGCPPDPQPPPSPDSGDAAPPTPPVPPPPVDGGATTDYDLACSALKQAGCAEGAKADCAPVMQSRAQNGVGNDNPRCVKACTTKACVHGCTKDIKCP